MGATASHSTRAKPGLARLGEMTGVAGRGVQGAEQGPGIPGGVMERHECAVDDDGQVLTVVAGEMSGVVLCFQPGGGSAQYSRQSSDQ